MADTGQFLGGAVGGASVGASIGGPPGAIIGAAAGGLISLFGGSPEEKRRKRKDELIAAIRRIKTQNIAAGANIIGAQTQRNVASGRAAAARRAAALGVAAEPMVETAAGKALDVGGQDLNRFVAQTTAQAGEQELQAETEFSGRPIEPSISDYILGLGGAASEVKHGIDVATAISDANKAGGIVSANRTAAEPVKAPTSLTDSIFTPALSRAPETTDFSGYLSKASASLGGIPEQTLLPQFNKRKMPGESVVDFYTKTYRY